MSLGTLLPHGSVVERIARRRHVARERARVTPEVRRFVLARDGHRCVACGSRRRLHVDHDIPVSRYGTSDPSNLQTLCARCNLDKGTQTMREWSGRSGKGARIARGLSWHLRKPVGYATAASVAYALWPEQVGPIYSSVWQTAVGFVEAFTAAV